VEEAKFYLYMEEEMEKSEFIKTAWRTMKPAIMKEQEKFKPTEYVVTEKPSETQEQPEEAHPEVIPCNFCFFLNKDTYFQFSDFP